MKPFHDLHKRIKQENVSDMNLRDHFAGQAMQAFVTAWVIIGRYPELDSETAMLSYKLADAMMEERNETN